MMAFQKEGLIADLRKINPGIHQYAGYRHRSRRSAAIAEHTGIMHNAHVQRLGDLLRNPVLADQKRDQLGCGTGVRLDLIDHAKPRIRDMMIDHNLFFRSLKIPQGLSEPHKIRAVQRKEHIVRFLLRIIMNDLLRAADKPEGFRIIVLQIDTRADTRIVGLQKQIKPHAASVSISVRLDMTADPRSADSVQNRIQTNQSVSPPSSKPASSSSATCRLSSIAITSSILRDMPTP